MARLLIDCPTHRGNTTATHPQHTHTHATYTPHMPPIPHSFPRVTAQHVSKRNHSKIHFTCFVVCPVCFLCACHAPLHPQPMPIKIFNYFAFYNYLFLSFLKLKLSFVVIVLRPAILYDIIFLYISNYRSIYQCIMTVRVMRNCKFDLWHCLSVYLYYKMRLSVC